MVATKKNVCASVTFSYVAVLQQLRAAAKLFQAQLDAGLDANAVMKIMFESWKERLLQLRDLSDEQNTELTLASNAGPWDDDIKKYFARAINIGVEHGEQVTVSKTRPQQKCEAFEHFVAEDTWIKIRDRSLHQLARCHAIAESASSIGIECPSQPTLFRMVAILAWGEGRYDFRQHEVFDCMDKIQEYIKASKTRYDDYVTVYTIAENLPTTIKENAYGRDMPTPVTIPALDLILGSNRMRGRSSPDKWLEHVPEEYRSDVMHCLRHGGSSHKPSADVHVQQLPPAALLRQERFHGNAPAFGKLQPLQYEPPLAMKKEPLAGVVEYKGNIKGEKADGALKS